MINKHIRIGENNTLKINRFTDPGAYLEAQDEEVVLLPRGYLNDEMKIDDELEVFVYTDSEDRPVATTEEPLAYKDQFLYSKVLDTNKQGAFMDIGLQKDLFVPKNRQKKPFRTGEYRIVRVVKDELTNRLHGEESITKYLLKNTKHFTPNQEVNILIFAKTPLGYKVIVENNYEGLLYENEIFQQVNTGDKLTAYIKEKRADGKLDISLQPSGKNNALEIDTKKILDLLRTNDGSLPYTYKMEPQTIKKVFGISKKAYKRALTTLIESKKIELKENGIELL